MRKILFIITAPSAGGAETYLLRFLEYAQGVSPTVLCKKSIHGELEERYREVATVEFLGNLGFGNPLPYITLVSYLKRNCYDVVCDFSGNFSGWDLLCARWANIPIRIAFIRESRNQFRSTFLKKYYAKLITWITRRVTTKILSNSYEGLNHFYPDWKNEGRKFGVIYNGLNMDQLSRKSKGNMRKLLHIPQNAFVICHTGRFTAAKNHEMILNCAEKLCAEFSDIIFVLIGRGVEEALGEIVSRRGLSDRVLMLGYRTDVLDILKCADLFYFPSHNEGQPNALIEAMASGLPFIASDIPSIKESVPMEKLNCLVPPDDLQANVTAIRNAYMNRDNLNVYVCEDWARTHFDSARLFNLFMAELV